MKSYRSKSIRKVWSMPPLFFEDMTDRSPELYHIFPGNSEFSRNRKKHSCTRYMGISRFGVSRQNPLNRAFLDPILRDSRMDLKGRHVLRSVELFFHKYRFFQENRVVNLTRPVCSVKTTLVMCCATMMDFQHQFPGFQTETGIPTLYVS